MPALQPIFNSAFMNLMATAGIGLLVLVILLIVFCGMSSLATAYDTFAPVAEKEPHRSGRGTKMKAVTSGSMEDGSRRSYENRPEGYTSLYGVRSLQDR